MPRDNYHFTEAKRVSKRNKSGSSGWGAWSHTDFSTTVFDSIRENAINTPRSEDGTYHIPTTYYANRSLMRYQEHRSVWHSSRQKITTEVVGNGWQGQSLWRVGGDARGIPSVSAEALNRCRANVRNAIADSDLNLGVALGEIGETLATIASIVNDARKLLKKVPPVATLKKLTSAEVRKAIRTGLSKRPGLQTVGRRAADEHLRFMYGIRPLMLDIYGLATHAASQYKSEIAVVRSSMIDPNFGSGNMLVFGVDEFTGLAERGCHIQVAFGVDDPLRYEAWRLGLWNPVSIAWELVTLSFVIDWFTGLGNWIEGCMKPAGLKFLWGHETEYLRIEGSAYYNVLGSFLPNDSVYRYALVEGDATLKCEIRHKGFRRTRLQDFPAPKPYIRWSELSPSILTNGCALLVAAMDGRSISKRRRKRAKTDYDTAVDFRKAATATRFG